MTAHRMHLKGPWEVRRLDREEASRRVVMPTDWRALFGDQSTRAEFRRKFNQPTNLEAHEHVWIVLEGIRGDATVRLNGHLLGTISHETTQAGFEITSFLRLHNELVVELSFAPDQHPEQLGGLFGPVVLEIRFDDATSAASRDFG